MSSKNQFQRPTSATAARSRPISALTNHTGSGEDNNSTYEEDEDIEEITRKIQIEDINPPVSPRDKLSYIDDKKNWKDFNKFNEDHPELPLLMMRMQAAIFRDKPTNIVKYLATEFFADHNQLKLREEIGINLQMKRERDIERATKRR